MCFIIKLIQAGPSFFNFEMFNESINIMTIIIIFSKNYKSNTDFRLMMNPSLTHKKKAMIR